MTCPRSGPSTGSQLAETFLYREVHVGRGVGRPVSETLLPRRHGVSSRSARREFGRRDCYAGVGGPVGDVGRCWKRSGAKGGRLLLPCRRLWSGQCKAL